MIEMRYALVRTRHGLSIAQEWYADQRRDWKVIAAGTGDAMRAAWRLLEGR